MLFLTDQNSSRSTGNADQCVARSSCVVWGQFLCMQRIRYCVKGKSVQHSYCGAKQKNPNYYTQLKFTLKKYLTFFPPLGKLK